MLAEAELARQYETGGKFARDRSQRKNVAGNNRGRAALPSRAAIDAEIESGVSPRVAR
jgi:hypothetical protein